MKRYIQATILPLSLTFALAACGAPEDEADAPSDSAESERLDTSRRVLAVDFASARGKRLSVAERTQRASRVLLAGAPEAALVEELPEPERHGASAARTTSLRPALRVTHLPETDAILLVNGPVADDHAEGVDIGEAAARRIFEDTIARLARDGLDDAQGLDLTKVKVSRLRQGSGQEGRPDTMRSHVKAYVFSAPRTVNGLEVLDSNLTIGVHRSGKLAAIHSRGVLPGTAPASAALAAPRERVVSAADLQKRVAADFPGASVQSLGLVYAVDARTDEKSARAVEPREVFMVFEPLPGGAGYSRGRKIAYSVTDARAPVQYLDTQLQNDPGDVRR